MLVWGTATRCTRRSSVPGAPLRLSATRRRVARHSAVASAVSRGFGPGGSVRKQGAVRAGFGRGDRERTIIHPDAFYAPRRIIFCPGIFFYPKLSGIKRKTCRPGDEAPLFVRISVLSLGIETLRSSGSPRALPNFNLTNIARVSRKARGIWRYFCGP